MGTNLPFIEAEVLQEHGLSKPHLAECVEETLVIVICDTSSVLNLTEHVTHARPIYSLSAKYKYIIV